MRAVLIPLWAVVLLAAGCGPTPDSVEPLTVTAPEEVKLVQDFRGLIPAHKAQVEKTVEKCQRQQEREAWWRVRLWAFGISALVAAAVWTVGRLAFVGGAPGAVLAWIASRVPVRWAVYAAVSGAAAIACAIWIDPVFTFCGWALYVLSGVVAGIAVWEAAAVRFTGHLDPLEDVAADTMQAVKAFPADVMPAPAAKG